MSTLGDLETKYFYDLTPEVIDQALLVKGLRPSVQEAIAELQARYCF